MEEFVTRLHSENATCSTYPLTYTEPDVPASLEGSESHATLRAVERLRYYIESGITSIRGTGSHGEIPFRLKEWVAANRIPGPRVFAAGQLITAMSRRGCQSAAPLDPITANNKVRRND